MVKLHFQNALLADGWARDVRISVLDRRIATLETGVQAAAADERHAIGVPGMASLHSHAFQRGMAGLAEVSGDTADTFWTWREAMYRFALGMSPEDAEAVATYLYVEMLEAGFTRVGEFHYLHHDRDGAPYSNLAEMCERIAAAADTSGIGLTLLPCFYAHSTFGGAPPHAGQRRFINSVDQFAKLVEGARASVKGLPGGNVGVAPHSLRAVTPEELRAITVLADDGVIHIHAAEQVKEVDDCVAWSGARPIAWLLENTRINQQWCVIHATHMTPQETTALAQTGAIAGLCPMTEGSLGDGVFPARAFMAEGGRFGIGTDSNIVVGVAGELRQLEYGQRLQFRERNVLARGAHASTGRSIFDSAISGGAQALAQPTAGLVIGASADIVSLDASHPSLSGRRGDQIVDGWIFAGGREVVDCVWTGGTKRVAGGRHVGRDQARQAFNATVARLLA